MFFKPHHILPPLTDESEMAIAKMKNLDESVPVPVKRKDVNTFQNNQVKFTGGASSIPPENMKCNILKAKMDEDHLKGFGPYHSFCSLFVTYNTHYYLLANFFKKT